MPTHRHDPLSIDDPQDIQFAETWFYQPETVKTDFSVDLDRVSLSYIQDVKGNYILTYELGLAFFRWKTKIDNRHTGKQVSEDTSSTLPLTGLHAIFPLGQTFELRLGFSGVFFAASDDDISLVDTYLEFHIRLAQYLLMGLGYRYMSLEGELDLDGGRTGELEFAMSGIYFAVGIKI